MARRGTVQPGADDPTRIAAAAGSVLCVEAETPPRGTSLAGWRSRLREIHATRVEALDAAQTQGASDPV